MVDNFSVQYKVVRIDVSRVGVIQIVPFDSRAMRVIGFTRKPRRFARFQRQVLRVLNQNGQFVFIR